MLDTFIAFDLETTGISVAKAEIIEIGAVRVEGGEVTDSFSSFVKPKVFPSELIQRLTGITVGDLTGQEPISEVFKKFWPFVGDMPLVAHNAAFDGSFLRAASKRIEWPVIHDTLQLSQILIPRLRDHKLGTLVERFGIDTETAHRAEADALVVAELYQLLIRLAGTMQLRRLDVLSQMTYGAEPLDESISSISVVVGEIYAAAKKGGFSGQSPPKTFAPELLADLNNKVTGEGEPPDAASVDTDIPVDPDEVATLLGEGGAIAEKLPNFESRPQQIEMARAVAGALNDEEFAVVEAGTGTGKSLAYLAPSILWAVSNGKRVVVSTNTRNLQEQLFFKDVPLLADSLGTRFDAVLLKGRGNYLCINAWRSAQMTGGSIIGEREKSVSLPLVLWSEDTASGDIAENTAFRLFGPARGLWSKLSAEGQPCSPQVCRFYDQCFMIQARRRAQNTHLVVVNHSLLFSDLSSDGSVLGDYDALVIDEAHNLEKVASDYMGRQATYWGLRDLLRRLYAKDVMEVGLIARIAQEINRAKMGAETKKKCLTDIGRAIEQIGEAESSTSDLFEAMTSVLPSDSDGRGFEDRIRYTGSQAFAAVADQIAQLNSLLSALPDTMKTINDHLERMGDNLIPSKAEFAVDLASRAMDVAAWSETLVYLTQGDDPEWVFWYELPARSSRSKHVTLSCAPLHVGKHLDSILYSDMRTIIFTSATLAVADKFTHFVDRSGLNLSQVERVSTLSVGSPFDFDTQALVTVPGWMPSPKQSQPFQDAVDEFLAELLPKTRRGTMVLYTSYKMLNQSRAALREPLREAGTLLLAQGQDGSRSALAEQFKTDRSSVLLGTDSFWEGIDIPGDALEMLVIVKLPFAVPSDPMISAHLDELEKEGKNPFLYYTVPEAAIKFRQGFGRLIRNTQDRGVVVLLDSRVITARYGRAFLGSLPTAHREYDSPSDLITDVQEWFA